MARQSLRYLAYALGLLSAGMGAAHRFRVRSPQGVWLALVKLISGAFAPYLAILGLLGAVLGLLARAPLALAAGLFGAWSAARYMRQALSMPDMLAGAFGADWQRQLSPAQAERLTPGRWTWRPYRPPEPRWQRDVVFHTITGTDRALLCDIWEPPAGTPRSGLAFVYFHGSGWHFGDKDFGTRPFFRHLAARGHVIMDVAYRLCPEVKWRDMLADVKHALAWMKTHAAEFGVDPRRVVAAGGSAGGHLALLAAYTAGCRDLTPADLAATDLTVCGVASWYGPTDMNVYYEYADTPFGQATPEPGNAAEMQMGIFKRMGFDLATPAHWRPGITVQENMMRALFGGTPGEVPEEYRLASPVAHAGPHCPPTLLLQGEHDSIVSAVAVRALADRLRGVGVPVVHIEYPCTEHAFDLILPQISPSAQASWYEAERFLALMAAQQSCNPL